MKKLQFKQKGRDRSLNEGLQDLPGRADMLSRGEIPDKSCETEPSISGLSLSAISSQP